MEVYFLDADTSNNKMDIICTIKNNCPAANTADILTVLIQFVHRYAPRSLRWWGDGNIVPVKLYPAAGGIISDIGHKTCLLKYIFTGVKHGFQLHKGIAFPEYFYLERKSYSVRFPISTKIRF